MKAELKWNLPFCNIEKPATIRSRAEVEAICRSMPSTIPGNKDHSSPIKDAWSLYEYSCMVKKGSIILEVGVLFGRSSHVMSLDTPASSMVLVDLWDDPRAYELSSRAVSAFSEKGTVYMVQGNSHDPLVVSKVDTLMKSAPYGFTFIDAHHGYSHVKQDAEDYGRMVPIGGLIGFHDYIGSFPGVVKVCNDLIDSGQFEPVEWTGRLLVLRRL
jgi:cephalosporin hydroxylase